LQITLEADDGRTQVSSHTAQVDDLQLIALPSAVNCADLFVRFSISEWSLAPLRDDAVQTTCQMVAAAVDSADTQSPGMITVRLRLAGDVLVVEVEDENPTPPAPSPALEGKRNGIVTKGRGRLAWCELPLPNGVTASAVPLPRRERKKSAAAQQLSEENAEVDAQVMRRVLSALNRGAEEGTH
jgi:hypothetical protein